MFRSRLCAPGLIWLLAMSLAACGAEGEPAPGIDAQSAVKPCQTIDAQLNTTLTLVRQDGVQNLATALDLLERDRPEAAEGLLTGLLAIVSEVWSNGVRESPSVVQTLDQAVVALTPLIGDVLRFLAREGPVQRDARAMLSEALVACPEGSLTAVLSAVTDRPRLLSTFGAALADPTVRSIVDSLPDGEGGSGQAGFVALVRTAANAVQSPGFVFADLVDVIDPFFDVDQPPIGPLLDELGILLSGESLTDLQAVAACMTQNIRLPSGQTGIEALGALLFGLITDPDIALGQRLDELEEPLMVLNDPTVAQMLNAVATRLQQDDALREAMKPGLRYLLDGEFASGALLDIAALLEAGVASDVLALLADLAAGCEEAP